MNSSTTESASSKPAPRRRAWLQAAVILLLLATGGPASASSLLPQNSLKGSPSPYLALHGEDPVRWQSWSAETVNLAKRSGRLLYVSVGYYACHWCHVMQRESYKDPRIAAYLNAHFIPVKVDRELNTGLDEALQNFAGSLIHQGGWPLNAFVTPEGYPLSVVLYQPPREFLQTLMRLDASWSNQSAQLALLARAAVQHAPSLSADQYAPEQSKSLLKAFLDAAHDEADTLQGGFGEVTKFPHAPQLRLLLAAQAKFPDAERERWLRLTLNAMADRGLRDHVYGGFFRYTTDPGWTVPHFEKMLYDNALLALLYMQAAETLKEPAYQDVARSALDFMLAFLRNPARGGFYSSTSAIDDQGKEGGAYLWSNGELKTLLPPAVMKAARRVWQLDQSSPFDAGAYLPAEYVQARPDERKELAAAYDRLRAARPNKGIPRDRKMLTGLNGLALSAFSRAAALDDRYRRTALDLYRFMAGQWRKGNLRKGQSGNQPLPAAELEDYAYGAHGLLDFANAFNNREAETLARLWAMRGWKNFSGAAGWRREESPLLKSIQPSAVLEDDVVPSPSAVLIDVSLRLNTPALAREAQQAMGWRLEAMQRDPFAYPGQIGLLNTN